MHKPERPFNNSQCAYFLAFSLFPQPKAVQDDETTNTISPAVEFLDEQITDFLIRFVDQRHYGHDGNSKRYACLFGRVLRDTPKKRGLCLVGIDLNIAWKVSESRAET